MNILVVETEPELASALVRELEEERFHAHLCVDGEGALQKSEERDFDLVLLDIMLPDLSGFDVAERLRERSRETPVLMLTARPGLTVDASARPVYISHATQVETLDADTQQSMESIPLYLPSVQAGQFTILVFDYAANSGS